jgi:hypothetical protein
MVVTASASDVFVTVVSWAIVAAVALAILAAIFGRLLLRRGLRQPWGVQLINRTSERMLNMVKRPITVAVLAEVESVLQAGDYTRNVAHALEENRDQIKAMVAEKIKSDPTAGRINFVPFHDRLIEQASETTLRVILEVLADPRTDELVSDMLRDNIAQIRSAIRDREVDEERHGRVGGAVTPARRPRRSAGRSG